MEGKEEQIVSKPKIEVITPADIKSVIPEDDGTVIVFGINASDRKNRKLPQDSSLFGALDEGQAKLTETQYKDFTDGIFKNLSPEERAKVDILVIASNANLRMPGGVNNPHKRSMETAEHILAGVRASMTEHGVNLNQLLNKTGKPIELTSGRLIDLKMWEQSPEFVEFLYKKYGDSKELWVAYEEDRHKDIREQMGAEGPNDIADRIGDYMATLDNAMKLYHQHHPGRKAVVILNTQYDSAAPMIKKFVLGQPMGDYVQIEKRGGIVFEVSADGIMSTSIQGHEYPVSFSKLLKDKQDVPMTPSEMLAKLKSEPLDPAKIEEVVNQFAEKHVQHQHGAMIFVGSGGGKSTTCREQAVNSDGKTDLVDADFVYRALGAPPLNPETGLALPWWDMGDEVILEVEKRCAMINEVMIKKGLWALTTSFIPEDSYVPNNIVIVILPWEEHKRRMITKSRGQHYDGGAKATDEGFALAQGHRKWAEEVARERNIPKVDSITAAIDLVRSREKSA